MAIDRRVKKLYLAVLPFLDNHDMHAEVARVTLQTASNRFLSRTLSYPGDLDMWLPEKLVGVFATTRQPRPRRHGLLERLGPEAALWTTLQPPDFPQPEFWATCLPFETETAVMSIVEIDLPEPQQLKRLHFEALGNGTAFGLVAVTVESDGKPEVLKDTPFWPEERYRTPRVPPLPGIH
jgi:hypothetical protein